MRRASPAADSHDDTRLLAANYFKPPSLYLSEAVLDDAREDVVARPEGRHGEEARVDGGLGEEDEGDAPDAEDAAHILRVGHDSEGEALVPRDGPPEAHAVVDALLAWDGAMGWVVGGGVNGIGRGSMPACLPASLLTPDS